jgi:hypothetical protein
MTSWTWRYEAADGSTLTGSHLSAQVFPSRADAESWVGESWRDLVGTGVEAVTLLRDGDVVYGPMSLRPLE